MEQERSEKVVFRNISIFLAGGLIGTGIALLYAPLSGGKTRQYIRIQTKRAKRTTRHAIEDLAEGVEHWVDEIKDTTNRMIKEGIELSREKKTELLATVELGKKAIEEEKKKIERILAKNETETQEKV